MPPQDDRIVNFNLAKSPGPLDVSYEDEVVITGLSGRFPESDNIEEFWENLEKGVDMCTDAETRWPHGQLGIPEKSGKIKDLSRFDAKFFGVLPKQAHVMDPQLRLLVECSYEAMVDAGYEPSTFRGRKIGVFIGASENESFKVLAEDLDEINGYAMTGCARTMFSNRVSYALDLNGPSFTLDTEGASSMAALTQALAALRENQCEAAIVGGSNITIKPTISVSLTKLGVISKDGICRPFDENANGFVRSETVGVMLLQKRKDARRIYGTLVHAKANIDGYRKEGILVPSGRMLEKLIREVHMEANINAEDIAYVEAHGNATQVGDIRECDAIQKAICSQRKTPLLVGSVKSNMGHAEAASGIASIVKLLLMSEKETIPANLYFQKPNPKIPALVDGSIKVVNKNIPLPHGYLAATNCNFGGTNVHCVLKPHKDSVGHKTKTVNDDLPRMVLVSGRNEELTLQVIEKLEKEPLPDAAYAMLNLVADTPVKGMPYRGYVVLPKASGVPTVRHVSKATPKGRPIWFIYTGVGSQWTAMARQMIKFEVFANVVQKMHKTLLPFGIDLIDVLTNESTKDKSLSGMYAAITAILVGLTDLLQSTGFKPDGIVGHSAGEVGCAYGDGGLTAEQAVLAGYWRGRCLEVSNLPKGAMAAVGLNWKECEKRCRSGVEVACHNNDESVTISGPTDAVTQTIKDLEKDGVFVKHVNSQDVAFHSKLIQEAVPLFSKELKKIIPTPKPRTSRWVSSSIPEGRKPDAVADACSPEYFVNNFANHVLFAEALKHVPEEAICIEIGPHALFQGILKRAISPTCDVLFLMKRETDNINNFLSAVGTLHCLCCSVDVAPLFPKVQFPVPKGTPQLARYIAFDHSTEWRVASWNEFLSFNKGAEEVVEVDISRDDSSDSYIKGSRYNGRTWYPAAGFLLIAWKTFTKRLKKMQEETPVVLRDIVFHRQLCFNESGVLKIMVNLMDSSGKFEICEGGTLVVTGQAFLPQKNEDVFSVSPDSVQYELSKEDIYKELYQRGYEYSGSFQSIESADLNESVGKLNWHDSWVTFLDGMLQFIGFSSTNRSVNMISKIDTCIINPIRHREIVGQNAKTLVKVECNPSVGKMVAGGISISGIQQYAVPNLQEKQKPLVEHQSFIPFVADCTFSKSVQQKMDEYGKECARVVNDLKNLQKHKQSSEEVNQLNDAALEKFSGKEYKLLRLLTDAYDDVVSGKRESGQEAFKMSIFEEGANFMEDILHTVLFSEDALRPICDIVLENTTARKIKVLEVVTPLGCALSLQATNLIALTNAIMQTEVTVAHLPTRDIPENCLPAGARTLVWDQVGSPSHLPSQMDLILANNITSANPDILKNLATLLKNNGFLVLVERSELLQAEKLFNELANLNSKLKTKSELQSMFQTSGLKQVAARHFNLGSVYLLRKTVPKTAKTQKVVRYSVTNHQWVDELRQGLLDYQTRPVEENVWLVADKNAINGVAGLVKTLRLESGDRLRCIASNSNESNDFPESFDWNASCYQDILDNDLVSNIYCNGRWGSMYGLTAAETNSSMLTVSAKHAYLDVTKKGEHPEFAWKQLSRVSNSSKNFCSVHYASLSNADFDNLSTEVTLDNILSVKSSGLKEGLGSEFSGHDQTGRRVMGVSTEPCVATSIASEDALIWDVPKNWSLQEASTVPHAYCLAYYALVVRGQLSTNESVLIHGGLSDVAQAAIRVALSMKCTVYTTVCLKDDATALHEAIPQLTMDNILVAYPYGFEKMLLKQTKRCGVDVVVSLTGEEALQGNVRCLSNNGRLIRLANPAGAQTPIYSDVPQKNISIIGVALKVLFSEDSHEERTLVSQLVRDGLTSGVVVPFASNVFNRDDIRKAFQMIETNKSVKTVICIRNDHTSGELTVDAVPHVSFDGHDVYVVVGDIENFGIEIANWLVSRGARKLALCVKQTLDTGYQKYCLKRWKAQGVTSIEFTENVTEVENVKKILKTCASLGEVGGIFFMSPTSPNVSFEKQTAQEFENVYNNRMKALLNFDQVSKELCSELQYFVAFSSMASNRGVIGQSSGAYGNSFVELICNRRKNIGLPATAIQWGPINLYGITQVISKTPEAVPQRFESCLETMDYILSQERPVVLSLVKVERAAVTGGGSGKGMLLSIAKIFGIDDPSNMDTKATFGELGMDSLMGVEVMYVLERELNITLTFQEIRGLNLEQLKKMGPK